MFFKVLTTILILSTFTVAQDDYDLLIKVERERYSRILSTSKINYPGDSQIDITYYGLDLYLTYQPAYLIGTATIGIKVDTTTINSFYIDLKDTLTVDSLLLNGSPTTFTHYNNKLYISMDRTYNQNEIIYVVIFYQGLPDPSGLGTFYFEPYYEHSLIWSKSEPYGTSDWFPCKDTPADKADSSDVWVTVDTTLIPVSNGTLKSITKNGDGTHTYHWKNHHPIAQYLISVAISDYYRYDTYFHYGINDSMLITHYIFPEMLNNIKSTLDETDDMMEVFSNMFGLYPFIDERYGHVATWGGGIEHQTCASMGIWGAEPIAHELAHQWFGDKITCKDWHHIWLNEGFATYAEILYREVKYGKSVYDSLIAYRIHRAFYSKGSIWVQNISDIREIFNSARTYSKGACILHMLRGVAGDETFFNIMHTYANDPFLSYGVATTEDFQAIAEDVYGQSLEYFFHEWIYGENYPKYTVNWGTTLVDDDTYQIDINITQEINSDLQFFTMPVQIKIYTDSGDTTITVFNNSQNQDFLFEVTGKPDSIQFDPGNWILKKVLGIINDVSDKTTPLYFYLDQNYPNPFNPSTAIIFQIPKAGLVTLKIYNVLGKEVTTAVEEYKSAGKYEFEFDGSALPSGVYFYRIVAGNYTSVKKMILLK